MHAISPQMGLLQKQQSPASWTHPAAALLARVALSCGWLMGCLKWEEEEWLWACASAWPACCRCQLWPHKEAAPGLCASAYLPLHMFFSNRFPRTHTHTLHASASPCSKESNTQNMLAVDRLLFSMSWCREWSLSRALPPAGKTSQSRDRRTNWKDETTCDVSLSQINGLFRNQGTVSLTLWQQSLQQHPAMAHLKLVPSCSWEKVAKGHTIWSSMWRVAALCRRA